MKRSGIILLLSFSLWIVASVSQAAERQIIFLGDSLTEGYGIEKDRAYPALLEKKLNALGKGEFKVTNAGISGATSAGAEKRLRWFVKTKPEFLILALGANDGLRGMPVKDTEKNLRSTIELAKANQMKILLAGIRLPKNYGKAYVSEFEGMYPRLARSEQINLLPFLLEGVAGKKELNLPDGIHPNESGHAIMAENVMQSLVPLL